MALQRIPFKKNRPYLLLLLLAAVGAVMFMLSKCSFMNVTEPGMHTEPHKAEGDTIDVAIEISPLSYSLSGDTITGLDYEIMQAAARIGNRHVVYHPFVPLDYAIGGLEDNRFDIVISSLPSTDSLKQRYTLSRPVYLDREILVQLKDSPSFISQPEQLANDTVWIASGSPFAQRIENLSSEIGEPIHIVSVDGHSAEQLIMMVAKGRIPRAVVNSALAARMKDEFYPDIDISTPISFTQFQCWIVSENSGRLASMLNTWLDSLQRTKAYSDIITKYGVMKAE